MNKKYETMMWKDMKKMKIENASFQTIFFLKKKIYDEKHTKFSFPKSWRHNEILLLKHPFGFFMGILTKCSKYLWKGGINLDP